MQIIFYLRLFKAYCGDIDVFFAHEIHAKQKGENRSLNEDLQNYYFYWMLQRVIGSLRGLEGQKLQLVLYYISYAFQREMPKLFTKMEISLRIAMPLHTSSYMSKIALAFIVCEYCDSRTSQLECNQDEDVKREGSGKSILQKA